MPLKTRNLPVGSTGLGIKLLTFTTLYPDSTRPGHGIFVENRLRHLLANGGIQSRVVAPVPWFPFKSHHFGEYARFPSIARREIRFGIEVDHPRYPVIPKIGMTAAPWLMAAALKRVLNRIGEGGYHFDIIDAHYFYPDGVAAVVLGQLLRKPVIVTARGTDLNLLSQFHFPRRAIQWAAAKAVALITVCQSLKNVLIQLGVPENRITVLRNGVDLELFRPPQDRHALRSLHGIHNVTLLCVGQLVRLKRCDNVICAMADLPDFDLLIAGDGPDKARLSGIVDDFALGKRVRFLGRVDHEKLAEFYGAADVTVLASTREGWANVLLESMACGTPVVATRVGGTPEVLAVPEAGLLTNDGEPKVLAAAVKTLLANYPDRNATRRYAERFSWDETTAGQLKLFREVLAKQRQSPPCLS